MGSIPRGHCHGAYLGDSRSVSVSSSWMASSATLALNAGEWFRRAVFCSSSLLLASPFLGPLTGGSPNHRRVRIREATSPVAGAPGPTCRFSGTSGASPRQRVRAAAAISTKKVAATAFGSQ